MEGRRREEANKYFSFILTMCNGTPAAVGIFTYLFLKPAEAGGIVPAIELRSPRLQVVLRHLQRGGDGQAFNPGPSSLHSGCPSHCTHCVLLQILPLPPLGDPQGPAPQLQTHHRLNHTSPVRASCPPWPRRETALQSHTAKRNFFFFYKECNFFKN